MELFCPEYFVRTGQDQIRCLLCERSCELKAGQRGICGVNKNEDGELKNLVYEHPAAINIDPVEKKPLRRFLPGTLTYSLGTVGCNFICPWCQNYSISRSPAPELYKYDAVPPESIVEGAIESGCLSVSYTYNEPAVFYPYARDIGMIAKENGLKNIFVTNGYQTKAIIDDMKEWVNAANIDLKCFDPEKHRKFTGGEVEFVKRNLKDLAGSPVHIEITTLVIPDFNDSDKELSSIAEFIAEELGRDVPWHVSAFHPDYKMTDRPRTEEETILKAVGIGLSKGLKHVYPGNI
jgi:pyruvate formate lyase activating enzyme